MKSRKNELKNVYRKLLTLYTATTGFVLTAFLTIAFFLSVNQTDTLVDEAFRNSIRMLESRVCDENMISDAWLEDFEYRNRMSVFVFDNGKPIFYKGIDNLPSDRNEIFENLTGIADKSNISIDKKPLSYIKADSGVQFFSGSKGEKYSAYVSVFAVNDGYRSIMAAQYNPEYSVGRIKLGTIFITVDVLGIVVLHFIGSYIIGKLLVPVEESRKRQSEFIAAASHELKSPLAVIRAHNSSGNDTSEKSSEIIEYECIRMTRLIEDMLLLASYDAEKKSFSGEAVDTEMLIMEIYEMFEPLASKKNISINLCLPDEPLPNIDGDYQRIVQLFSVIIDNAIYYSVNDGKIEISAETEEDRLSIAVADHGAGISDEDKKRIFDRFYRTDKSRNDKSHFGLGLSIAKELAEAMNGTVSVKDTDGGGSTFIVRLNIYNA